jgi:succinate dehydrogenase/fumarate reductase flavoprotein subunit
VDSNWESSVTGLYAVGEAAGTFGAYRPGGSALNSAQVGAMRAAEHIAGKRKDSAALPNRSKDEINYCNSFVYKPGLTASRLANQTSMSRCASFIRDAEQMKQLRCDIITQLDGFFCDNRVASGEALPYLHKSYDILLTQAAVLSAMICSAETLGSHGGALVKNVGGAGITDSVIITHNGASFQQPVRPLPPPDDWFESVWERYALRQQLR